MSISSNSLIKKAFYGVASFGLVSASAPAFSQGQRPDASSTRQISYVVPLINLPFKLPRLISEPQEQQEPPQNPPTPFQDSYETVAGRQYFVSARVHRAFADAKLPKDALIATCARESSCDPSAVNPTSKACGLFQLMTDERTATLYEAVYNYGSQYGYAAEAAMVRRELLGYFKDGEPKYGYYPVSATAKKHLVEKCLDPEFSTKMHEGYTLPKVMAFKAEFGRDMTHGDLAGMNNWGDKGWKMIVEQVQSDAANGRSTPARVFFSAKRNIFGSVAGNASMFRTGGRALSITEAYRKLVAHGGETVIEMKREPAPIIAVAELQNVQPITVDMSALQQITMPTPKFR